MNLQTKIPLEKHPENLIGYRSNTLLIGSCFSENIGKKLDYFKFQNLQNPFGILFHPKAIETLMVNTIEGRLYSENDIFNYNEQWHCFDAHSKLSHTSKEDLLNELNAQIQFTKTQIQKSTHIVITLGTAWVYREVKTNVIVANCHKVPQKQFEKVLLSVDEVKNSLRHMLDSIRRVNHKASVIFTVSPIRHIKDGFIQNTLSKSHLIAGIHKVLNQQLPIVNPKPYYFPSYEIMMDELRDYRFYAEDMVHPNPLAINYIWEKFKNVWVSSDSFKTMEEVEGIQKGLLHKPFNAKSQAHQRFLQKLEARVQELQRQYPHMVF
jgi:Mor family transcriptional regulator